MQLDQLLGEMHIGEGIELSRQVDITSVSCDSRKVKQGDLFVALKGSNYNGNDYIGDAIDQGACAIATSEDVQHLKQAHPDVQFLTVDDPKSFLRQVTEKLYGNPSQQVKTIGITGTNGKTTITYLIESILNEDHKQCGVIGTVNYRHGTCHIPATRTTPDYVDNQKFLFELAQNNIPYCVMEASSHALLQERVYGIDFCAAIFTNLTGDHLDYHKTKESYFLAKAKLFTPLSTNSAAIINTDDDYGQKLCSMTEAEITTYGIDQSADVMARDVELNITGSQFTLSTAKGSVSIKTKLIGIYNIYNILAAASACLTQGLSLETIKKGIECMINVPGRLEQVEQGQDYAIFIDYAHTQDALDNVLTALRQVSQAKIICVFGCGGDRDKTKRSLMGQAASQLADYSIVTSDNPRSEEPESIIDEIIKGFRKDNYKKVIDRKEAIEQALAMAQGGDIVLIAGKGHETYQVFADQTIDFNERAIIEDILQ